MNDLLFEYKVRYRYKTGYKEFSFYATTEIEEFLNRNSIEYVRSATDTVESRLFKEIERLNNIIEEIREYTKHKIVECYDEGSTIGEFYKICNIDSKIEELLHKGEDKE